MDEGGVVGIIGLGNDDLGIGIHDAQEGQQQCLRTAGGNQYILGIQIHIQVLVVSTNLVDQDGHTGRSLVFQSLLIKMLNRSIKRLGRLQIGLTDIQMVNFLALLLGFHRIRVELTHRRGLTAVCIDGNSHKYLQRHEAAS